jgi:hypothetical protein
MQTFLPYPDFAQSARCLDRQRLGKQRVEALQIVRTLRHGGGWRNHPAVAMWRSHENWLIDYGLAICAEWTRRGYVDTCAAQLVAESSHDEQPLPWWFGLDEMHRSHRSNLLRKNPEWYAQFWDEVDSLPYYWPKMTEA